MLVVLVPLVVCAGIMPVFFMNWPWWRADRRKMVKDMAGCGDSLVEMRVQWWSRWERVATLMRVPVREYTVLYTDQDGPRHQTMAEFFLPWWLNKMYDPSLVDSFELTERDYPGIQE